MTYAAYKAERALAALRDASERGVQILFIVELSKDSGGKLTVDGLQDSATTPSVCYWPLSKRPRTEAGQYGAMHVKCLIAYRKGVGFECEPD